MPIALDSATSGMNAFQQMMDVIGNNIANVNTVGYKSASTTFEDLLSQTLNGGSAGNGTSGIGGTNPVQVGLGTQVAAITSNFAEGSLQNTGGPSDLAINGSGFFIVSPSTNGGQLYYTRAGSFHVDSNGYLVNPNGYYLMGVAEPSGTTPPSQPAPSSTVPTLTAVNVFEPGATGTVGNYTIAPNGLVTVNNSTAGGSNNYYYLPLVTVPNEEGLVKAGGSLYLSSSASTAGGAPQYGYGATGIYGSIQQGALEGSNVNLTKEMSNMIVAQTGYESNSKVINTENQMDQFMLQQV
ncbi:flagellar hook-basal body protein [Sulfoacidibacillus thermotolerans]|uniref:Flagellar hook protein FlgE n=1 Tax=Sulfoacidibacillus thermotolerans TaxID=1765684 RepID=A0A2U3D8K6_SULT2|nr:flagellar hook-basal body complex protein [Sulfoacidibacillus thermotolerans]PWI57601.1 hypothetical protein BM613_07325 [Sulfoacidibacillus thermotolerans]